MPPESPPLDAAALPPSASSLKSQVSSLAVECLHAHANFPQYQRGDLELNPSPELLKLAAKSGCFHLFTPPPS